MNEAGQRAIRLPAAEVILHGGPGWKAGGQTPPLTTNSTDITHGAKHLPQTVAAFALNRQQVDNNLPLRVSKGVMTVSHKACGSLGTPAATYWLASFCPLNAQTRTNPKWLPVPTLDDAAALA